IGKIEMAANTGTCIDSPFHRFVNGKDLSGLQLDSVANLNSLVIRQTKRNTRRIEPDMLKGKKLRNKAVLVHTGWDRQMIDTHRWKASCTKSPERCHPASLRGT
ncbi:MAG TPA: cyclase family protein, partial [Bacteroidota bacterium]